MQNSMKEDWLQFLTAAGITGDAAVTYATTFVEKRI